MSLPLSPRSSETLNKVNSIPSDLGVKLKSPTKTPKHNNTDLEHTSDLHKRPSSPFDIDVDKENANTSEDFSPFKSHTASQRSPTKDFVIHEDDSSTRPIPPIRSLSPSKSRASSYSSAKGSPVKGSPRKVSTGEAGSLNGSLTENNTFSLSRAKAKEQAADLPTGGDNDDLDTKSFISDDTRFSTFSEIPNADMTLFAKLGLRKNDDTLRSPTRRVDSYTFAQTPTHHTFMTPATSRRHNEDDTSRPASPTPRQHSPKKQDDTTTTNLLLDFTQQFDGSARQSSRSPAKSTTEPNLLTFLNNQRNPSPSKANIGTPGRKSLMNLLDFDLPPQPTPRSMPTITIRELESMKSNYLSEISSLKASLNGRQAEVDSLKKAVSDAERRVGEAQESVREERSKREYAEKAKDDWEKKGKEVESILKNVREECETADKEREELLNKLEESNRAREEAEMKAAEVAMKTNVAQSQIGDEPSNDSAMDTLVANRVAAQIDEKMETLARDLHGVYKKKHETKVATLKKTYEARSDKKCAELQSKIEELAKHNEDLQSSKDASLSQEFPAPQQSSEQRSAELLRLEEQKTELEEQKAKIAGLIEEMSTVKAAHDQLACDLECERVEKGELVAAVDEMLALQMDQSEVGGSQNVMEDLRRSISKPASGLRGPGFGDSRMGKPPGGFPQKIQSAGKSKMIQNIQRMGGRAE